MLKFHQQVRTINQTFIVPMRDETIGSQLLRDKVGSAKLGDKFIHASHMLGTESQNVSPIQIKC